MVRLALFVSFVAASPAIANPTFGPGEQTTYLVRYFGLEAGTVEVTTGSPTEVDGTSVWPIVLLARTESVFRLYPVRDKFVTFWMPEDHRTLGSDFFANEGGRKRRLKVELDHPHGQAQVSRWNEGGAPESETFDVRPGSFDMCAVAYAVREKPMKVGDTIVLPVFTGRHAFDLTLHVETAESITVPAGTFPTLRLGIETKFGGKFQTNQEMVAWITDDDRHVLVRVDGSFALGTLNAELVAFHRGMTTAP
jgi:hypothetical protein